MVRLIRVAKLERPAETIRDSNQSQDLEIQPPITQSIHFGCVRGFLYLLSRRVKSFNEILAENKFISGSFTLERFTSRSTRINSLAVNLAAIREVLKGQTFSC